MSPEITIDVPNENWVATVNLYIGQYGAPTFSPLGSGIENSTKATWDTGGLILHLKRVDAQEILKTVEEELLLGWATEAQARLAFKVLKVGFRVKDEIHKVTVLPVTSDGRPYDMLIGTVYLFQFRNSLNVIVSKSGGVIHNSTD